MYRQRINWFHFLRQTEPQLRKIESEYWSVWDSASDLGRRCNRPLCSSGLDFVDEVCFEASRINNNRPARPDRW